MHLSRARLFTIAMSLTASIAAADDRATVEKSARAALAAIPQGKAANIPVAKDGVVLVFGVTTADDEWPLALNGGSQGTERPSYKPGTFTVGVDTTKGVAWFIAPVDAHADALRDEAATGDLRDAHPYDAKERFGGLALKAGASWQLVSLALTHTMPDKQLVDPKSWTARAALPAGKPVLAGDADLAATAADWIKSGFAAHFAATPTLIAAGTAPSELKSGAPAKKLAASWDKLGLVAEKITATTMSNGTVGVVAADVLMPRKTGKGAIAMSVAMFVVRDADQWKWVLLQFGP